MTHLRGERCVTRAQEPHVLGHGGTSSTRVRNTRNAFHRCFSKWALVALPGLLAGPLSPARPGPVAWLMRQCGERSSSCEVGAFSLGHCSSSFCLGATHLALHPGTPVGCVRGKRPTRSGPLPVIFLLVSWPTWGVTLAYGSNRVPSAHLLAFPKAEAAASEASSDPRHPPLCLQVEILPQGRESPIFKQFFKDWQ